MEQLPRLTERIASLIELRDLFGALRTLAASRLLEAQSALGGIRNYVSVVEDALAEAVTLLHSAQGNIDTSLSCDHHYLILISTEHGFAGGFNEKLLDQAKILHEEKKCFMIVGSRGKVLAEELGLKVDINVSMATHAGGIPAVVRRVVHHFVNVSTVDIVFASYRRGGIYEVTTKRLVPINFAFQDGTQARFPPVHYLTPTLLFQRLTSEYLFAALTRSMMESLASENGARLQVMESADHNIAEKLGNMHRLERLLRQDAVTSELLDLVTGAEATLSSNRNKT